MVQAPTTLERLRVFHAIAVSGSIAAAARSLDYTPSAVSQQLSTLEREVGVALVERSNRGITITAAGRELVVRAVELLDAAQNSFARVRDVAGAHIAPLAVAAFPTAVAALLLPLVTKMSNLRVVDAESEEAMRLLEARAVDAAIVDGDAVEIAPTAAPNQVLLRSESAWLVGPDHGRGAARTDLSEYRDVNWALGAPDTRFGSAARAACRRAGFEPHVVVESEDHQVSFEAIRAGDTYSMLPDLALTEVPPGVVALRQAGPMFTRRIEFVSRYPVAEHPRLARLVEVLVAS